MTIISPPATDPGDVTAAPPTPEALAMTTNAQHEWENKEQTRSTIAVFAFVMAAMALVASVIAWGFASNADTHRVAATAAPAQTAYASAQIDVSLSEFSIGLPAGTFTTGVKTLRISNPGKMQHELLVFHPSAGIDPNRLPVGPDGNVDEEAPGINKVSDGDNIDPGGSQTRSLDLSQAGTYVFVCNLPAHYKLGMHTVVNVVAPTTAPPA